MLKCWARHYIISFWYFIRIILLSILCSKWDDDSAATSFCRAAVRHMVKRCPHYGDASGAAMDQSHAHAHNSAAEVRSYFEQSIGICLQWNLGLECRKPRASSRRRLSAELTCKERIEGDLPPGHNVLFHIPLPRFAAVSSGIPRPRYGDGILLAAESRDVRLPGPRPPEQ